MNNNIPKIIHFCWFGDNPISELGEKCIESWKKYFPDYKIMKWTEKNFDFSSCQYAKEAYEERKWAHVSDYVRLHVLYHFGGIYFDTDVEVINDFSDIIGKGGFMGYERETGDVASGLGMGVEKYNPLIGALLEDYQESSFYDENGNMTLYNTIVKRMNKVLADRGVEVNGKLQEVDGIVIYPKEYFNPLVYESGQLFITENTHSIHWYDGSWMPKSDRHIHQAEVQIKQKFNNRFGDVLCKLYRKGYRFVQYCILRRKR